jgi:hypothetical protein
VHLVVVEMGERVGGGSIQGVIARRLLFQLIERWNLYRQIEIMIENFAAHQTAGVAIPPNPRHQR